MSKYLSIKAVAGALVALFLAYAYDARADQDVSNLVFTSGTSFEALELGAFAPNLSDGGEPHPYYFWQGDPEEELGSIVQYGFGEAYDYAAHGLERNPYLANHEIESGATKYYQVRSGTYVHRSIFGRDDPNEAFSNVVVRTGSRDSIYCDVLVQFSLSETTPVLDDTAKIAVWAYLLEKDDGELVTNMMVTAGCFTNGFRGVLSRHYRLETDADFDFLAWHRLTIRAHGDVSQQGVGLSAFSVYIDGRPVRAAADDYAVCVPAEDLRFWFKPEARALQADRRLFPSRAPLNSDAAFTVSGFTFFGEGRIDDVSFSSEDPGYARPEAVFTVNWDAGFAAPLACTLDGGATTIALPVDTARTRDILIGSAPTNGLTLRMTEFHYKTDLGFKPGVWLGSNGAVFTNGTDFVYDGSTRNPVASVASTRECVYVGTNKVEGCYDTFKSAFAALDRSTNEVKTLTLNSDVLVSASRTRDAYGNRDEGSVQVTNSVGEYVLDLDGHTLRGQIGKNPTLVIRCRRFRIIDSSLEKTGRILPVQAYTNASDRLNTSVLILPQAGVVEPEVTLQDGIYDGWVRNRAIADHTNAVVGALFVEGGSYYSTNAATFYLESCVTNLLSQFVYRASYWSCLATNVNIWTGLGDGLHWQDPGNWRTHAVPKPNETAFFPSRPDEEGPWTVDVRVNEMSTKRLWLEGDVFLTGTNDFLGVSMKDGAGGRFAGTATLVFDGDQPDRLTETTVHPVDWAGTVLLRNIGTGVPMVLKDLDAWGTANSSVEFNGVRGYVMDKRSFTMPYGVVLRDRVFTDGSGNVVTNYAWQNDSGYTGSTLAFTGPLTGSGTFRSGANIIRPVLQLFKFAVVHDFRGRFSVEGKRVLVGRDIVMASVPGLIAFGDDVPVASDLGWTCWYAAFGSRLQITGRTNDVLVTCTKAEPDVSTCTSLVLNGVENVAWLACTNEPAWTVYVSGKTPSNVVAFDPDGQVPDAVFASAPAALLSDGGYSAAALRSAAYVQAANAVQMADVAIEISDAEVLFTVSNASRGLWYGIRHRATLEDDWGPAGGWCQATGPTVRLSTERLADAGFYGVVVTYEDPYRSGGGCP